MKILHTADWHKGAYVGPQCDDPYLRMGNTIKCLDKLVEKAIQEQPDIILVAGDIFHAAKVWSDRAMVEVKVAADCIKRLEKVAPVVIVYGTPSHDNMNSYIALREMTYNKSIWFITDPEIKNIATRAGVIQVAGIPGFDKGFFRSQYPGFSSEEENKIFTQGLANILTGLSAQLDPAIPSVLMAHHTVVGCEMDNGTHIFQANEVVLDAAAIDNSNFDLVCLGHIHKAQQLDICSKPAFYSGSIDAFTFNDEGTDKGFYIHHLGSVHGRYMGSQWYGTPAREFYTCRWNHELTEMYSTGKWEGNFENTFCNTSIINKVVRVLYTCDQATEKAFDKKKLERDIYAAGAYYVSEICPEKIEASVNRERMHEKMTVEGCLQRYFEEKELPQDRIDEIMEVAFELISEVVYFNPESGASGMFLPIEIEVRNYRSYSEETFSFRDIYFAMVNGRNGSGKSSLFMDAITDCLYEKTREGELTGWIKNGEKSGSISFTFMLGGDTWRVTRTRMRSGKGTLALSRQDGNTAPFVEPVWEDHSCDNMVDTQGKVIELLGMDCETFQSCVLIMQDRYGKFMEADKETRMSVLSNLLGLGVYEELEQLLKEKMTEKNREIRNLKSEIGELDSSVSEGSKYQLELEEAEKLANLNNHDLQALRKILVDDKTDMVNMDAYLKESKELSRDIESMKDSMTDKKLQVNSLISNLAKTQEFLNTEELILQKSSEYRNAELQLASLDGKLSLLKDKRNLASKTMNEFNSLLDKKKGIRDRISNLSNSLEELEKLKGIIENSTVEQELLSMDEKAKSYQALSSELSVMKTKYENAQSQTEILNNSECINITAANCRFLKAAKESVEKARALKLNMDQVEYRMNQLKYDPNLHTQLKLKVKEYREAKDKLASLTSNVALKDSLEAQLDDIDTRISVLKDNIGTLDKEISSLKKETAEVDFLKDKIVDLKKYEDQKLQIPKAKQYIESTQQQLEQLDKDIIDLEESIIVAERKYSNLMDRLGGHDKLAVKIAGEEASISTLEEIVNSMNQKIGSLKAALEQVNIKKIKLGKKNDELMAAAKTTAIYSTLVMAFSQDGIPFQIIRDIIPELEASANEILGQMTAGRMRLEFRTEKVLKSNKNKEVSTLDIIIIDVDNGVLPYLSRSGGQKVRAALAVNFALANIKASRVGLQLGMMFVDEPPFLDAEGVEAYCTALSVIHERYPDMRILAISHDENMKSHFPQQITVVSGESGSKVICDGK